MTGYLDLTEKLAGRIADGELPAGAALPSVRELAAAEGITPSTVTRAYRSLAAAGVIRLLPRRAARVQTQGMLAARSLLRRGDPFRLAGSDDPVLNMLIAQTPEDVAHVGALGSYGGVTALWAGRADGATMHLRHRDGEYNAPFVRGVLSGREPVLIHLWRRQQGLVVPSGNPRGLERIADVRTMRLARRPTGTGTRTLLDRLLLESGIEPDSIAGPTVDLHLDVALAVATGEADVGLGLCGAATALGLDFVPVTWEPFEVGTTRAQSGGMQPILHALEDRTVREQIAALGGYDLTRVGEVTDVR